MEQLAESYSKLQQKPALNDQTNRILDRKKEFYKRDVLQRFEEHGRRSGGLLAAKKKYFNELVTPFAPKLNDHTKLLASQSIKNLHNGKSVYERLSKSPSAKCVKHEKSSEL